MTNDQLSTAIRSLLDGAQSAVGKAAGCDIQTGQNSWIAHMTTSMVLGALANVLMDVRQTGDKNGPSEKNIPQL
jgi:hypothetical protein